MAFQRKEGDQSIQPERPGLYHVAFGVDDREKLEGGVSRVGDNMNSLRPGPLRDGINRWTSRRVL